jgi:hypothetical protein
MGDVSKQLTSGAIRRGECRGARAEVVRHAVEGVRQRTDFVTAALDRANVSAAFTERARRLFERLQSAMGWSEDQ